MRGARTKKSIEQHIEDGTYRPDRHGYINKSDDDTLQEMKNDLYADYILIRKAIKKLDLSKSEDKKEFEHLNTIRINFVKAYHNIARSPVESLEKLESEDDNKDEFKL